MIQHTFSTNPHALISVRNMIQTEVTFSFPVSDNSIYVPEIDSRFIIKNIFCSNTNLSVPLKVWIGGYSSWSFDLRIYPVSINQMREIILVTPITIQPLVKFYIYREKILDDVIIANGVKETIRDL